LKERSPLFRQLEDQIRYAISVGDLVPGSGLPSIRDLEQQLGVNRNTVRRAYLELEAQGLIDLRQGREARVATPKRRIGAALRVNAARELAESTIQRAEAQGIDALAMGAHVAALAREHDAAHPRCAFVECSRAQAGYFAARAQEHVGRRVVAIDLHELRDDRRSLPPSVRCVLTPHWHLGETRHLLRGAAPEVFGIRVQVAQACREALRAMPGSGPVGLLVRDAHSAPGFAEIVREHTGAGDVRVVLSSDRYGAAEMLGGVRALVYTTPCAETARELAPPRLPLHELAFDPDAGDIRAALAQMFPPVPVRRAGAPPVSIAAG
jgi:GntR family transcriptional regulator